MDCNAAELLCVMAARYIENGRTIFAGVGLPLLSAVLASKLHALDLEIVVEGGCIGMEVLPGRLPISTNEMRLAHRATMLAGVTDTLLFAQRGYLDLGFVGGAQIDRYGNLNSSVIGPFDRPVVRLPGSGGANDMISLCREVMVVTLHDKRRFVPKVDFVTSPGFLRGGSSRREAGLHFGGVSRVITDLGVLGFDGLDKSMRLEAVHPGVTTEMVRDRTGFELGELPVVITTEPPSQAELAALRALDPDRTWLG
jgi:glutaconate CoA-transferase subunit B